MVEFALPRQLRALGERAISEAIARRAGSVEAEHVLLAILERADAVAAIALGRVGVNYTTFEAALDAERTRSLAAAGIAPVSIASIATTPRVEKPTWGASVRDLLRRSDKPAAKNSRPGALEIELGTAILRAELGTVPRALAVAGIDRLAAIRELQRG
jgi:ATP-dependent Clp protease ATP-binding subunit ClpA